MYEKRTHALRQDDLLTAREAAQILPSTSAQTVLRWARVGAIAYVQLPGGRRFFRRSDVEAILTPRVSSEDPLPEDQELPGFVLAGGEAGEC